MTEKRRAPIEVLERLAEAVSLYAEMFTDERERTRQWPDKIMPLVLTYRAATAPLRTRASVDAEIAGYVRAWWAGATSLDYNAPIHSRHCISKLCREPTADDHGSSSTPAAKESRDNAGVSAGPANEPEACSCDQALELQRIISHVHALALELVQVTETTPP